MMVAPAPLAQQGWERFFRSLFRVAALYDGVLGATFFFLYQPIFRSLGIPLPDNASYVHLTAGFVFVQGVGYWLVSRNIWGNVDIVRMGVLYKAIYTAVALYYLAVGQLLNAVFAWFAVFDIVFLVLFVLFLMRAGPGQQGPERAA
jgi:hypothetical protein